MSSASPMKHFDLRRSPKQALSVTAKQLKLYLKQHHLKVSGNKPTLVARVMSFVSGGQMHEIEEDDVVASDSGESEDSGEYSDEDSDGELAYMEQGFEVLFVADTEVDHVVVQNA